MDKKFFISLIIKILISILVFLSIIIIISILITCKNGYWKVCYKKECEIGCEIDSCEDNGYCFYKEGYWGDRCEKKNEKKII